MRDRRIRRRVKQLINELELPPGFDIEELCRRLGERRGRPIHLLALSMPPDSPCGMWVSTPAFDAIFYAADTSRTHQELIISHEIGHILCGHVSAPVLSEETARLLLPDLDPALVQRTLGRTNYTGQQEREAETMGTLLLRRAHQPVDVEVATALDAGQVEVYGRLRHSLEHPDQ